MEIKSLCINEDTLFIECIDGTIKEFNGFYITSYDMIFGKNSIIEVEELVIKYDEIAI
jgi:hypothetical protein